MLQTGLGVYPLALVPAYPVAAASSSLQRELSLGCKARGFSRASTGQACGADSHFVGRAGWAHAKTVFNR